MFGEKIIESVVALILLTDSEIVVIEAHHAAFVPVEAGVETGNSIFSCLFCLVAGRVADAFHFGEIKCCTGDERGEVLIHQRALRSKNNIECSLGFVCSYVGDEFSIHVHAEGVFQGIQMIGVGEFSKFLNVSEDDFDKFLSILIFCRFG